MLLKKRWVRNIFLELSFTNPLKNNHKYHDVEVSWTLFRDEYIFYDFVSLPYLRTWSNEKIGDVMQWVELWIVNCELFKRVLWKQFTFTMIDTLLSKESFFDSKMRIKIVFSHQQSVLILISNEMSYWAEWTCFYQYQIWIFDFFVTCSEREDNGYNFNEVSMNFDSKIYQNVLELSRKENKRRNIKFYCFLFGKISKLDCTSKCFDKSNLRKFSLFGRISYQKEEYNRCYFSKFILFLMKNLRKQQKTTEEEILRFQMVLVLFSDFLCNIHRKVLDEKDHDQIFKSFLFETHL